MARYIDADILLEELRISGEKEGIKAYDMANREIFDACVKYNHGQYCYITAQEIVKTIPTADVVEVKHGYWIVDDDITECSNCHKEYVTARGMLQLKVFDYCPHCGAKMDGGKEE